MNGFPVAGLSLLSMIFIITNLMACATSPNKRRKGQDTNDLPPAA